MTLKHLWDAWRRFWFEPQPVGSLALFRIFFGLLILQSTLIHVEGDFLLWYGPNAIIPLESVKTYFWHDQPRFDILLLFPNTNAWLIAYFVSFILSAVFTTLGLFTRYSAIWLCLGMISLHQHDPFNINGGDAFLRLMSIFLACSPCGHALSLDNILRRKFGLPVNEMHSPCAQRMIQVQVAIAYCATFFCKISGSQWLDGTAVYYATRLEDLVRFPVPYLFNSLLFCKMLSWYTLVVEFAMWTLVWLKDVRYYVLASTFVLHFGIDMAINLPVFEWAFIASLITFVDWRDLQTLCAWSKKRWLDYRSKHAPAAE
ncbi:MAG: HTTM domain-containing protein [Cyanobacteria bacterium]|nr:HTTM domain-containing protein [Cyanobacteriota bacterium]